MRSEVRVVIDSDHQFRFDLDEVQPMPHDGARAWLNEQFNQLGCEPLRPTGKVLLADMVLVVAQAGGVQLLADAAWGPVFARAASAVLARPVVHIDVSAMTVAY
jgi:hypothetical protein